jgi:hypothetical protein
VSASGFDLSGRRGVGLGVYVLYLVGVAGLAFAIASVWLGMRAVMDLGGSCASGGPYQVRVECPDGVSLIMFLAFPLGFLSAGIMVWKGSQLGGSYAELVGLAWPALFLSLGFNFLQYAVAPPDGSGEIIWGWLIPGVIFMLMGGLPLIGWLGTKDHTSVLPGAGARPTPKNYAELARALRGAARVRAAESHAPRRSAVRSDMADDAVSGGGLVPQLERLAALHSSRALTDSEYEAAKTALIRAASRGELA